jgi:hypothetical protein
VPLTPFQEALGRLLATNRSEDSYLAGAVPILDHPASVRTSQDLDYFHDTAARVASAFAADRATLETDGCDVRTEISQPGFVRATVSRGGEVTKVEWAQDSTWRFMPVERSDKFGFVLHPIDLATNKILALAGRDEPRDLVDTLHLHHHVLPLGPLIWAAAGKDPGFSPRSLLEILRRRGRIRPEDLHRLGLELDPEAVKADWLAALADAETFVASRPAGEAGCLYWSQKDRRFVDPRRVADEDLVPHFGRPGGVLPRIVAEP